MGAAESTPRSEENDLWWRALRVQQHNENNMLSQDRVTGDAQNSIPSEGITEDTETSLKQIQKLASTVTHLANENMRLVASKRTAEQMHKDERQSDAERLAKVEEEAEQYHQELQILRKDMLQNQLQSNEERSELTNLRGEILQYKNAMKKAQEDAQEHQRMIYSLKSKLETTETRKEVAEKGISELNLAIEKLRKENEACIQENKRLQAQIVQKQEQPSIENNILRATPNNEERELEKELLNELKDAERQTDHEENANFETEVENASSSSVEMPERRIPIPSPKATAELERFREQIRTKREARHQALSAISNEMERLRAELSSERTVRRRVTRELEMTREMLEKQEINTLSTTDTDVEKLKSKLNSERVEKNKITQELLQVQRQTNQEIEQIIKELDTEKGRTQHVLNENKCMKTQLEESDQMLLKKSEEYDQLQSQLNSDKVKYQNQVSALKEVVSISKQMLTVRENQVAQLKKSLTEIEIRVGDRHGSISAELKVEYESQIHNIKSLKALYEDRMKMMESEKEKLKQEYEELSQKLESETQKSIEYETQIKEMESSISERNETVSHLQDQLSDSLDQSRNLSNELALINNMFTQMLIGNDMNLDKLIKLLQENHDLITEMTIKEDCDETAASLPKLLLDLVTQMNATGDSNEESSSLSSEACIDQTDTLQENTEEAAATNDDRNKPMEETGCTLGAKEIASNLPKVWKVLLELLSHHVVPTSSQENGSPEDSKNFCYKSVETPNGPRLVISVSKTFIRLKDLIIEKKSLQKELTHLKQLNGHLESKLTQQERRLSLVSSELRKTWNVVGHMRTQHQQLHTHEKILRYELQQKRKLLTELKQELEYCREKWEDARKKNSQSEVEWRKLRKEFAARKKHPDDSLNNSGESGFSDEKGDDSGDDEDNRLTKASLRSKQLEIKESIPSTQLEYFEQPLNNTQIQSEIENPEMSGSSNQNSSLPDLISVSPDINISLHNETPLLADTDLEQDQLPCEIGRDGTPTIPEILTHTESTQILENGSNKSNADCPSTEEYPSTISLITLLKQQLSYYSETLEMMPLTTNFSDNIKAIQSIFSLPPIQIPEHLHHNLSKNRDNSNYQNKEPSTSAFHNISSECAITHDSEENVANIEGTEEENYHQHIPESRSDELPSSSPVAQVALQPESKSTDIPQQASKNLTRSISPDSTMNQRTEEVLDARAVRLKRLEEQCQQLFNKVTRTTHRSAALSNRLEELHEQYGNDSAAVHDLSHKNSEESCSSNIPEPPTLPTTLPTLRLPTQIEHIRQPTKPHDRRSTEEVMESRAARLRRLEEQCQQLFNKVTRTTHRSTALSNQLDELHEHYGTRDCASNVDNYEVSPPSNIPKPPPLPSTLPHVRLPTEIQPCTSNEHIDESSANNSLPEQKKSEGKDESRQC